MKAFEIVVSVTNYNVFAISKQKELCGVEEQTVGSKSPQAVKTIPHSELISLKIIVPRVVFGTHGNPKWHHKSTFGI